MRRYTHDASARSAASTDCGYPRGRFVDHDPRVLLDRASWTAADRGPKCYPDPTGRQPDAVGFKSSPRVLNGVKMARYADTKRRQAHDAHGAPRRSLPVELMPSRRTLSVLGSARRAKPLVPRGDGVTIGAIRSEAVSCGVGELASAGEATREICDLRSLSSLGCV